MPGGRGRGGRRSPTPGKTYGNRTDLAKGGPMPMSAVKGQPYGANKAQMDSQRAVPMGTPPLAPAGGPPQAMPALPEGVPAPGSMGDLFAPSTNPAEDVMSGADMGPGHGPEAFGFDEASMTASDMDYVSKYLPGLEEAANRNGDDPARQIVRLLKARLPMPGTRE